MGKCNDPTRCENCQYWEVKDDDREHNWGLCRRYPPVMIGGTQVKWIFPLIHKCEWCGDFDDKSLPEALNTPEAK